MKFKLILFLLLSILIYNCKSDKKSDDIKIEQIEPVITDTIVAIDSLDTKVEVDTTSNILNPIVKEVVVPKKSKTKPLYTYNKAGIQVTAINHATMVLEYNGTAIYVDPVGGKDAFKDMRAPTFIIITDIHGDHLNAETIQAVSNASTVIIGPKAVQEQMPENLQKNYVSIFNGLSRSFSTSKIEMTVEAIAMYNLPEDETSKHPKGRGNGYILTINGKRIYISGDTEDTFEMRHLKHIDMAFVCMNLPYTMTVDSAASAVLQFKPKEVFPYHYRGKDGFSDVAKFKTLVNESNRNIKVIQLDWYH